MLVVGVGNLLLRDEGFGVHVARALLEAPRRLPAGMTVREAGTSLLDLVPELAAAREVVVVDAMRAGGRPGAVYRLDGAHLPVATRAGPCSLHEWGVPETMGLLRRLGRVPRRITVLGAEPLDLGLGLELSAPLARAARRVVSRVRAGAWRGGRRRRSGPTRAARRASCSPR